MRKNEGKPKLSKVLYMPKAIEGLIDVIEFGERKYSPASEKGWLGYKAPEVLDSMLRHITAMMNDEAIDPESGFHHAKHILFNAAVYLELISSCSSEDCVDGSLHEGCPERYYHPS